MYTLAYLLGAFIPRGMAGNTVKITLQI